MKKLRYLRVEFDGAIKPYEIPAFRGAVAEKAGLENALFHNHDKNAGLRYRYPLIQYKTLRQKPALLCIEQGVDEVHKFFENKNWEIAVSGEKLNLSIDKLDLNQFTMQVWNKTFAYGIRNWIALNQDNYQKYQALTGIAEKIEFLEKKLIGNILAFAKGIEWHVDKQIELKITDLKDPKPVKVKDQKLMGFNATFHTNVFLPNFIGLGKNVSLGYGVVKKLKK
jgi:hypothetical protein